MDPRRLSLRALLEDFAGISAPSIDLTFELTPDGSWSASGSASTISIQGPGGVGIAVTPTRVSLISGEPRSLELEMTAGLTFHGLPSAIQGAIDPRAVAEVSLTEEGLKVTARSIFEPVGVAIPPLEIPGGSIELGDLILSAKNLTLVVGREVSLSVDLGVGLPPNLNKVFQSGAAAGLALGEIFETYDPERPEPNLAVRVTARSNDIDVRLLTSPLRALKPTLGPDGSLACDVKLGPYGEIAFTMPVFRLDWATKSLSAEGRFRHQNLRLPLGPIIELLKAGGMARLAEKLPRSVPLKPLGLAGAASALAHLLKETLGEGALKAFAQGELSKLIDRRLPGRLNEGLFTVELPSDFAYRIEASPDLSGRILITTAPPPPAKSSTPSAQSPPAAYDIADRAQQTPLKLLVPILGSSGPEILRLTLYSLAFGEILAGQILTLEVDAEIDRFELAPIALAAALSGSNLFPPPEELTLRIGCRDLFSILVAPGGVQIPVPLFFRELSLVSRNLDGLYIESRWQLPAPARSLSDLARCVVHLRDVLLHPSAAQEPNPLRLALTIGPSFVRLPDYLGGQLLGSQESGPVIDAFPLVARALAALRRLDFDALLACIPDALGVKEVDIEIGSAFRRARWLLSAAPASIDIAALSGPIREGLAAIPTSARVRARLIDVSSTRLRLAAHLPGEQSPGAIDVELRFADLLGSVAALARLAAP
jgi:hypothetical protein